MTTDILSSLMAQCSPTLGLPTSCAQGFPGGTPQCWAGNPAAGAGMQLQGWKPCTESPSALQLAQRWNKVTYCQTRHLLTVATCPQQGKETSPEDHREENCSGCPLDTHTSLVMRADVRGVLSLCSIHRERWGCSGREQGSRGRRTLLGKHRGWKGCGVRELLWGQRVCAHARTSCRWWLLSKTGICKPLTWNSPNEGMELLLTKGTASHCPLERRKLNTSPSSVSQYSSVRGLRSPDTPHEDVLQKSWYRLSFHHHHLNIHRKGK